ncbi:MAG: hypothetical protein H6718_34170 [Polyangiaceae bacterium]|nr:hypothetical protein [Polyangiaceae bacterium]
MFVAPTGDDTSGTGSRAAPFATLAKAVDVAAAAGKRVFACADAGTFTESLALTAEHAGVDMYGDFKCQTWTHDPNLRAVVAPESPGFALWIDRLPSPMRLEGFRFEAQDAVAPGESSIAGFILSSADITIHNVRFDAGAGADGAPGDNSGDFSFPSPSALVGNAGSASGPGAQKAYALCPGGGTTVGGRGGDITSELSGASGSPALGAGAGGDASDGSCSPGLGGGETGASGATGGAGAAPSDPTLVGYLSSTGWTGKPGSQGDPGGIGQGGGGGRGSATGGGGSGGAGGCGGAGGGGGQAGGGSIGLVVIFTQLHASGGYYIHSTKPGNGGSGALGQLGMDGGDGGPGYQTAGCGGGRGGKGGRGGPGGGGAGGVSVALMYHGPAPELGAGGLAPSPGGTGGAAVGGGNKGVNGFGQALHEIP